jgi:UDP:flavonoid glycosyltransferase YjiC (YdhE family)
MAPCGIGLGHITRLHPIAEELNKRGFQTVFSTYLDGLDYAKRNQLPTFEAAPINFQVKSDGTIDFKLTAATSGFSLGIRMFLRQVTKEIQFLKQFRPDVVVSDSRASSLVAAKLLKIPVVLILNQFRVEIIRRPTARKLSLLDRLFFFIANIGWLFIRTGIQLIWGGSRVILIPDLPPPYTICQGNLAIPRRLNGKVKLIGPITENHIDPLDTQIDLKRKLGFDPNPPLIYAGVSGPRVERGVLARVLLDALPAIAERFQVVLSRGEPDGERNVRLEGGVRVFDWIENQDDFIRASDLVVSRAGHGTIMKALVYGKPLILIPIPDHTEQYANAKRATSLKVAQMIDQNSLNADTLEPSIQSIVSSDEYKRRAAEISAEASSTHAVSKACDMITQLASRT